ncbi:hypothetical protein [Emticicia sp. C21]|nr:hypothetical protein [Emticicia sp. C21]
MPEEEEKKKVRTGSSGIIDYTSAKVTNMVETFLNRVSNAEGG